MEISYLAGLVDGEGCIRLHPSNKGIYRKYYPRLQVTNSYKLLLDMLVSQYGGAIHGPKRGSISTKDCWDWRITGDKARQLLIDLIPFLIVKKEKAIEVLSKDDKQVLNKKLEGITPLYITVGGL